MRIENWPRYLNEYIVSKRDEDFEWGVNDCVTFTAGAIMAITDEDPMPEFRDQYDSEESAEQALKDIGEGDLYRTLVKKFGKSIPGAQGQRGDVAYHEGCCGVVIGPQAIFIGQNGYALVPLRDLQRAFRVK